MLRGGLAKAKAGSYAQVGNIVLQHYQHYRRQGNYPKQSITILRTGGKITCPVAGVDKSYRNKQPRTYVPENFQATKKPRVVLALEFFKKTANLHSLYIYYCQKTGGKLLIKKQNAAQPPCKYPFIRIFPGTIPAKG